MIVELLRFCLTVAGLVGLASSSYCNYCYSGDNGAQTNYITPPCKASNFPKITDVGTCSRATPFPIYSNESKFVDTSASPLILQDGNFKYANITNVGTYLQVTYLTRNQKPDIIRGGLAYRNSYAFYSDKFFWASSTCGFSGTTINGQGAPLEIHAIHYNTNYGTFEESLKHPDGLLVLIALIQVKSYSNPAFNNMEKYIPQIKKYGSSVIVPFVDIYPWSHVLNDTSNYFAYPGQYIDQYSAVYNCSTVIALPFSTASPYIGESQFRNTFLKMQNQFGKPLSNALAVNRKCDRPLVCTQGIISTLYHL